MHQADRHLIGTAGQKKGQVTKPAPVVGIVGNPNADSFPLSDFDYVVDAIDTVSAKIELAVRAETCGTPIISSMGTGNKLDPTRFEITDIYKTSVCPLARVMRRELKARSVKSLKVVYSKEEAIKPLVQGTASRIPGSISFVPSSAGLLMASVIIRELI